MTMKPILSLAAMMTACTVFALFTACQTTSTPEISQEEVKAPEGMQLVWSDEFNQEGFINPANWTFEEGFVRNHEDQWYQKESAAVKDGNLVITAEKLAQPRPNPTYRARGGDWKTSRKNIEYTSACLRTIGLQQFQYGRIEARIKAPLIDGAWPAFWTLGVSEGWPSCGEIDIFEYYRKTLLNNICLSARGDRWAQQWYSTKTPLAEFIAQDADWANQYHVYAMDWDEHKIDLLIDGKVMLSHDITNDRNATFSRVANPFRQPHYLLVNMALGGDNGGDLSKTPFPIHMYVDYVRVFQKGK